MSVQQADFADADAVSGVANKAADHHAKATKRDSPTDEPFDPTWNYRPRWLLFFFLPYVGLITLLLSLGWNEAAADDPWYAILGAGWEQVNGRDFWVPILWALWMPWFNGPRGPVRGTMRFVMRDFNDNDTIPMGLQLMHGMVWSACILLPVPLFVPPILFAAIFLLYDIILIRYGILQIYFKRMANNPSPMTVVASGMGVWWVYLAIGLALSHYYGNDEPLTIVATAAMIIAPMQLMIMLRQRHRVWLKAQRVAVIGAGWSGVYAAKWLLQEGRDVRVFEKKNHIGGLWKYDKDAVGGVSEDTYASSSNFYMHASDFPMNTVAFPSHQEIYKFINDYADHFKLREHVSLNTSVTSVRKVDDKWVITGQNADGEFTEEFDAVVVASGVNEVPKENGKLFQGFDGEVLHSAHYKNVDSVKEHKRIIVVGLGESAADIAHECARIRENEVYLSGTKQWFAGRFMEGDYAADTLMAPGVRALLAPNADMESRGRSIIQRMARIMWGTDGSGIHEWRHPIPWLHGFITKSRAAVEDAHRGKLTPKTRIVRCSGRTVEFDDGSTVEADLIIDCTGFVPTYPFLEQHYKFTDLHRLVFCRKDPTLSFVGTARPVLGSIPALAEMQARWIAAVYSGRVSLANPTNQEFEQTYGRRAHKKRFFTSEKRPNLVDHSFYADLLAREMNISVPWFRILLTRPHRFKMLLYAPWMAFKYELRGKNRNQALENIREHMPKYEMYYWFMKRRFILMGKITLAIYLAFAAALVIAVPPYIFLTVGSVFSLQWLIKEYSVAPIKK